MTRSTETLQQMEQIVAALDPITRAVFLAVRLDGLPYSRIADALGIGIEEIEKRVADAIYAIAKGLDAAEAKRRR